MHGDAVAKLTILMIVLDDLPSGHITWPARLEKANERFGHLKLLSLYVFCDVKYCRVNLLAPSRRAH